MKHLITILVIVIVAVGAFTVGRGMHSQSFGNVTTQSIVPKVSAATTVTVGPQGITTLAAAASNCTTRIISTVGQPVMLSFSSLLTPSATAGHYQAASTSVSYDNAVYGCGAITAYGYGASTTITVTSLAQ